MHQIYRVHRLCRMVVGSWHLITETFKFIFGRHVRHLAAFIRQHVEAVAVLEEAVVESTKNQDVSVVKEFEAAALASFEYAVVYRDQVPDFLFVEINALETADVLQICVLDSTENIDIFILNTQL